MDQPLDSMTALGIRQSFLDGAWSAREIVEHQLALIEAREPQVDAFLTVTADEALHRADTLDRKRSSAAPLGALAGVPVAVKDNICTRGIRTTCASRILDSFVPTYNAHVVELLEREDAIVIGKTNMDEFAMGSSTENSGVKITKNPWDATRIPGGSSGGSAAAVAARMVPIALGSDTGGSVRQPAALCGVVGMKPTYGRVSRYGLVAFGSSLDQIGPFGRTVEDVALLLGAIAEPDGRDSTCTDRPVEDYLARCGQSLGALRIGLPAEFFLEVGMAAQVSSALAEARKVYERLGASFHEVNLPHSRIDVVEGKLSSFAVAAYYILCTAEASSNLARYDGVRYGHRSTGHADMIEMYSRSRAEGFGDEVKRRIMLGTFVLSRGYYDAYYLKAARVRALIRQDFERAFERVDVILCPTSPTAAFAIGEKTDDPLEMYLSDIFTISCNLAGTCGISVPCGFTSSGLPVGMQLLGAHWQDALLLQAAAAFQRETDFHEKPPPLART